MWRLVEGLGFDGGEVLEPGCGSGHFIGFAPDGARMTGIEVDPTTSAITKLLYPDAVVRREGFEKTRVPEGHFDLVVGNVPFGRYEVADLVHNKGNHNIHTHFLLKSLHLVREGGLVAVLTSRHTMDGAGNKARAAREEMADLADLVGAVRSRTTPTARRPAPRWSRTCSCSGAARRASGARRDTRGSRRAAGPTARTGKSPSTRRGRRPAR
ncbi:Eco57I restriction-modification methylase domain-containing protein [Kitasatospora aburaviensis]